ncbi:AAA family ATPase [Paludifilum halophilum]|uniref:YhaN AAA domain-containing protein n=1 Tax=Paludifilum halophilum TaxID=1642702 RepID=A0A235B994_9BACL|nr:AAA family ATPase [Paludifilum halophilum]OYD08878.1 hypothetical protein CHM34_03595 [Paludifilum halophilum]
MKLERVYFRGFGRWVDRSFTFGQGLNLVEAPNESGKTTLLQGVTSLLYGAKKEGISRRQKESWYDQYRPWTGQEYGGEVDFSVGDRSYRLVRSLTWDDDREQLVDLKTGRDLTGLYSMDRRKDRRFMEGLIGLSRDLFQRVVFLSSQSLAGDRQVVEKIRQWMTQGEETDLEPVLAFLEGEIQRIGKTSLARSKPYGTAVHRAEQLEREVIQLKNLYQELREDQARLAQLDSEWQKVKAERASAREKVSLIRQQVRIAERREALIEKKKHLQYRQSQWEETEKRVNRLQKEREEALPPHWLNASEVEELSRLIEQYQSPASKVNEWEERIEDLDEEIIEWQEKKSTWLGVDEALLQRQLHRLEEVRQLERELLASDARETVDEKVRAMQLEKEYYRLIDLQEREEQCRRRKGEREDRVGRLHRRLDRIEREKFLSQLVDTQIPPGRSSSVWVWTAGLSALLSLLIFQQIPGIGLVTFLIAGFALYRFDRLRRVDRQVRKEWEERQQALRKDWDRLRREREEDEKEGEETDPEAAKAALDREKEELRSVYDELARLMQEQESILDRWGASSAADLHRVVDSQRQKVREREAARSADEEKRARIEEIRRDVQEWAAPFAERLGSWDSSRWLEDLSEIGAEARQAKEVLQRLKLESASLKKEVEHSRDRIHRIEQEMARWKARLGTDDIDQWLEWIRCSEQVRRIDDQLKEAMEEREEQERQRKEEDWTGQLQAVEAELAAEKSDFPDEESGDAETLHLLLQEAEADLDQQEQACYDKEVAVLKLEEQLKTRFDRLPGLGDRETLLQEARNEVQELEFERSALETAREVLQEALREVQEDIAPKLRPYASRWIRKVTVGRYEDLLIDPVDGLRMSVFVPETGERQPVERLSRGTVDQMYFALRLALIRFFSRSGSSPLPLILDDSLVHFDEDRMRESLRILGELARDHQIILCTCQPRERRVLEEEGISFVRQQL